MMPLEEMRPFLAVSADADPEQHPELLERIKSHREHIVSQIASLQQVVDFIDSKLGDGKYRRDCSDESQDGLPKNRKGKANPKPVSPAERSYFPVSAKAGK